MACLGKVRCWVKLLYVQNVGSPQKCDSEGTTFPLAAYMLVHPATLLYTWRFLILPINVSWTNIVPSV